MSLIRIPLCAAVLALSACASPRRDPDAPSTPTLDLSALTVTPDRLPSGCALKPPQPSGIIPMESNPARVTDPRLKGLLRQMMDPASPPSAHSDVMAALERRGRDVTDAYLAVYAEPGAPEIGVWALRYRETIAPAAAKRIRENPNLRGRDVFVRDDVVLFVWSDGASTRCFDQVRSHVRAIAEAR